MGFFDGLSEHLTPHAKRLNDTIALQGAILHARLERIEKAVSDQGRPDFGDKWRRLRIGQTLLAGIPVEIGEPVPMNEIWEVQFITSNSAAAYTLEANGYPVFYGVAATVYNLSPGGDIVLLPGEVLSVVSAAGGAVALTLGVIRRPVPHTPMPLNMGRNTEYTSPINTHDPARDEIASRTDIYTEIPDAVPGILVIGGNDAPAIEGKELPADAGGHSNDGQLPALLNPSPDPTSV